MYGKPTEVTTPAYPLVDMRGKPIKIGDMVAVGKNRAEVDYHTIIGYLEVQMEIREDIPYTVKVKDHWSASGYRDVTHYNSAVYPCNAVTYLVVLDSKHKLKRPTDEVLLLA